MARIRTIKPEFFTSEDIVALTPLSRLLYIALWCEADREGRFEWKPKTFRLRYLPADDCDIEAVADELTDAGLVVRYEVDGKEYACIPTFTEHQVINNRESQSKIPARVTDASGTREIRVQGERKGKEGKGREEEGGADAPAKYAFEGKLVRVTSAQVNQWRKAYPRVPDMMAELQRADDYYTEIPPKDGKWFFAVSSWLARANEGGRGKPKIDPMFVPAGGG